MTTRRRPGRPYRNIADRFRAAIWAGRVKLALDLSWDELDRQIVLKVGRGAVDGVSISASSRESKLINHPRIRVMHRIYKSGDNPEAVRTGGRGLINLVSEAVAIDVTAGAAHDEYCSPLWTTLIDGPPDSLSRWEELAQKFLDRMGLVRITDNVGDFGIATLGKRKFPHREGDLAAIDEGAANVSRIGTSEALLLLGLECRFAIDRLAFQEAQCYINALDNAVSVMARQLGNEDLCRGLEWLIHRRIIRGDWSEIGSWAWSGANLTRGRMWHGVDSDLISAARFEINPGAWSRPHLGWPIVEKSPQLVEVLEQMRELREALPKTYTKTMAERLPRGAQPRYPRPRQSGQ